MKRLISLFAIVLAFITSTAFNEPSDSIQVPLKDSIQTIDLKVKFGPTKVTLRDETVALEKFLAQQGQVNETIATELNKLNAKLPNMTASVYQAKLEALEEGTGIDEEAFQAALQTNVRLTKLSNLLLFIAGLTGVTYLMTSNNRIKRGPDLVLKISTAASLIIVLVVMRVGLLTFMTSIFNPTYHTIQQFIQLGG